MRIQNNSSLAGAKPGITKYHLSPLWVLSIILFGISVRLINYFSNSGLWLDEALLSLNLIEKSFPQLFQTLERNQVAPVLFLLIEKLSITIFGPGEKALRLFPLLCSLSSLPLFYFVAKGLLKEERPALIALFIFALTPIQIRYSSEVKQYMTDEFIFLLLLWLFQRYRDKCTIKALLWLGGVGFISFFLSHITVLILFTISIFWIISDYRTKRVSLSMIITLALWLTAFSTLYYFFILNHAHESFMQDYWKKSFMPLNPLSHAFWQFFTTKGKTTLFDLLLYNNKRLPVDVNYIIALIFLLFCFGGLIMAAIRGKYTLLYFLAFPVMLHLFLSGIHKYPFETRLALYLSPVLIISISYGMERFRDLSVKVFRTPWPGMLVIGILLLIFPYKLMLNLPVKTDGARDCMQFINKNYIKGQPVYIPYYTLATFEYYMKTGRLNFGDVTIQGSGLGSQANWDADLRKLKGQHGKIWLLFSHLYATNEPMHKHILEELKKEGKIRLAFHSKISATYLIDLGP